MDKLKEAAEYAAIDRIKFFGSVASTNGISEDAKTKANKYIIDLLDALQPSVREITASLSGITT